MKGTDSNWIVVVSTVIFLFLSKYSYELMLFALLGFISIVVLYIYTNHQSDMLNMFNFVQFFIIIRISKILQYVSSNYAVFEKRMDSLIRVIKRKVQKFFNK